MPKRDTPDDLDDYLPDDATRAEVAEKSPEFNEVDPKLVEKLRRLGTNPDLMRAAPPSETAYVPPTEVPGSRIIRHTGPRVEVALPPPTTELPTMPSLRRLQGEPEVPGVVKGPAAVAPSEEHGAEPRTDDRRTSVRRTALALLAVLIPVVLVIVLVGRQGPRNGPAAPTTSSAVPAMPSAQPSSPVAIAPPAVTSAPAAPSVAPSTTPSATAPAPTGPAPKHQRRGAPEDPYEVTPPATSAPSATSAPTVIPPPTPTVTPAAVPTAAPSQRPPTKPAQVPDNDGEIFNQPTPKTP